MLVGCLRQGLSHQCSVLTSLEGHDRKIHVYIQLWPHERQLGSCENVRATMKYNK